MPSGLWGSGRGTVDDGQKIVGQLVLVLTASLCVFDTASLCGWQAETLKSKHLMPRNITNIIIMKAT